MKELTRIVRGDNGRLEISGVEIAPGIALGLLIDGHWIMGVIENWSDEVFWFSRYDGVPVVLHSGLVARLPEHEIRRFTEA